MEIICAYCGKHMGFKDGEGTRGVSHGICIECFHFQVLQLENTIKISSHRVRNYSQGASGNYQQHSLGFSP